LTSYLPYFWPGVIHIAKNVSGTPVEIFGTKLLEPVKQLILGHAVFWDFHDVKPHIWVFALSSTTIFEVYPILIDSRRKSKGKYRGFAVNGVLPKYPQKNLISPPMGLFRQSAEVSSQIGRFHDFSQRSWSLGEKPRWIGERPIQSRGLALISPLKKLGRTSDA
jgi:hypothetical protein